MAVVEESSVVMGPTEELEAAPVLVEAALEVVLVEATLVEVLSSSGSSTCGPQATMPRPSISVIATSTGLTLLAVALCCAAPQNGQLSSSPKRWRSQAVHCFTVIPS